MTRGKDKMDFEMGDVEKACSESFLSPRKLGKLTLFAPRFSSIMKFFFDGDL